MYKTWLFLHILGVFVLVGGVGLATALGIKTSKSKNARAIAAYTGLLIVAERFVITPGAILTLVAGSFLVHKSGYDFDDHWIIAAYVLWVIAMGIGHGILARHSSRVHKHATQLVAQGVEDSDELGKEAAAPVGMIFGMTQNVILILFIYLMVVRPGT